MLGKAAPVTVLKYAAVLLTGLIYTTSIADNATAADLRLRITPKARTTPPAELNRAHLYEEFLRWLETHPAR